ncbi:hypothetical protein D3C87_123680 [compost metagenome]
MFSKSILPKAFVLMALAGTLSSCIGKIGEAPPPQTQQKLEGTQCLSKTQPVVSAFFKGEATVAQVEETWDCVAAAIDSFKRYVRGRTEDRYTTQELATFLEDNFLELESGEKISVGLQREFMKFKQLLIGGSADYVSRAELDNAKAVVLELRTISIRMNPYMKVISMNWSATDSNNLKADMKYFEDANLELQNTARTIANVIEKNGHEYVLSDFVTFMKEMSIFLGQKSKVSRQIEKYMPVVKKVKRAIAGGDENIINPREWRRFSLLGARGYVQYLRYHYFIDSVPETGTGYRLAYLSRTVEDIFSVFYDLVGEKPEGVVSRDEVNDLLMTLSQVWPEFRMSPNLVLEVMKLKQLFFGGSVDTWTAQDFDRARLKVDRIKTLVERFLPYWSVYGLDWDTSTMSPEEAQQFFQEAQFNLEATGREVGALLESSYNLEDLERLAQEIDALYPADTGAEMAPVVRKFLPLLIDSKNIVFGGEDSSMKREQWSPFLAFSARFYSDYLYYIYFMGEAPLHSTAGLGHLSVLVNQTLNIVRDLLVTKETPRIERADVLRLLKHAVRMKVLPATLKQEALDDMVDVVLNNVLIDPAKRLAGVKPEALTLESIEVLRDEFQVWINGELFIATITEESGSDTGFTPDEVLKKLAYFGEQETSSKSMKIVVSELARSVKSTVPMTVDGEGRLIISTSLVQNYNSKSLRQLNLNRAIARLATRAFAKDEARISEYSGLKLDELEGAFLKVKPLFVEMGLLEPSNTTFASSRFREANIFTPHADGNVLASHAEFTDIVGMIFSGLRLNTLLKEPLLKDCLGGRAQVPSTTLVSVECAKKSYRQSMPDVMSSMPEYLNFMKKTSESRWSRYMSNVFKAAGYVPNKKGEAKIGDISLAPHVIQYIEMVYARFDKNKDGFISATDAVRAFPAFKGIIKELAQSSIDSGDLKEKHLVDLFTFILRYGKPPETLVEKMRFAFFWRDKRDKWDTWADRSMLAQILGYIADQVAKSNSAAKLSLDRTPSEQDVQNPGRLSSEQKALLEEAAKPVPPPFDESIYDNY